MWDGRYLGSVSVKTMGSGDDANTALIYAGKSQMKQINLNVN